MNTRRLVGLVVANVRGSKASVALATVGVAVGIAFLSFFVGLGEGLRERVLNRIFPANQLELEPRAVRIFGVEGTLGQAPLDDVRLGAIAKIAGVRRAVGKQKSAFPARLWGGKRLLGFNLHAEAFFDGLPAGLMRPELQKTEAQRAIPLVGAAGGRCDVDIDCRPGQRCVDGACEVIVWSRWFDTELANFRCDADDECRPGRACVDGQCRSSATSGPESTGKALVQRCRLRSDAEQWAILADKSRGHVVVTCDSNKAGCVTSRRCPEPQYCAPDHPGTLDGTCELPVPTVLNPLLLEVFNSDMAASLGIAKMASTDVLYGVRYHIKIGDSHFTQDAERRRQMVKQAIVVGFSAKAPELGVAMPLEWVRYFNARLAGKEKAGLYDAVIVETASNQVVPGVIDAAEDLGFALSRRSRIARTFGTVVFLVYLALVLIALVVLAVAALNIAQTLAMLVHERRREIAILRSIGANRRAIWALVVGEAVALGAVGGLVGYGLAWGGAVVVDAVAAELLAGMPLVPESFFLLPAWLPAVAVVTALSFCILGALGPARRATRLDPADVLSQG